ncbi:UPF0721 transmembrane protein [Phycisphaerae bacterium]|nr:UPF0721 transmembrane protein [Phycisphaerae bacterium]
MNIICISAACFGASAAGSLVGLGGGVLIIPILTVGFGMDIRMAMGVGLISIIATSCGPALLASSARYMNMRVALLLELVASIGAIGGAMLVPHVNTQILSLMFGVIMLTIAILNLRSKSEVDTSLANADPLATLLRLDASAPNAAEIETAYHLRRIPGGAAIMLFAGIVSGLLGIASGALKILAMDNCMNMPARVSSMTSNFMIGITAAAGALVFFSNGFIDSRVAIFVIAGALPGSILGAKLMPHLPLNILRLIFVFMLFVVGIQMFLRGLRITL